MLLLHGFNCVCAGVWMGKYCMDRTTLVVVEALGRTKPRITGCFMLNVE